MQNKIIFGKIAGREMHSAGGRGYEWGAYTVQVGW